MIPFSAEAYFASLSDYTQSNLVEQMTFLLLGFLATIASLSARKLWSLAIPALLAGSWIFLGGAYHIGYFSELNFWDYPIGMLCFVQAALILWFGFYRRVFDDAPHAPLGTAIMLLAIIGVPLLGILSGRAWTEVGTICILPGPTILFTAGALMLIPNRAKLLWALPVLVSVPALILAWTMPIWQDFALLLVPALAAYVWTARAENKTA